MPSTSSFYSDIFNARGRSLDHQYRAKRPVGTKWSDLIFPIKNPPGKDLRLWNDAIDCIAPQGIPKHMSELQQGTKHGPSGMSTMNAKRRPLPCSGRCCSNGKERGCGTIFVGMGTITGSRNRFDRERASPSPTART